jgi:hypothetical protein
MTQIMSSIPKPIFVDTVYWYQEPRIKWNYYEPQSTFATGIQDSGKSWQNVAHGTNYIAHGGRVMDCFGAENDSETLTYLQKDCPYRDSTLLLIGDDVDIESNGFPTRRLSEFNFRTDLKDYLVVTTDRMFFGSEDSHYMGLYKIFKMCVERRGWKEYENGRIIALIIREAWRVIYSQIRAGVSRNEQEAQYELKRLNYQRAHNGVAPLVDTQRYMDLMPSVRSTSNFKVIKGFGGECIPDEFDFLWKDTVLGADGYKLRHMPPYEFLVVTSWNGVAQGIVADCPWRKVAKGSDMLEYLGIRVQPRKKPEDVKPLTYVEEPVSEHDNHRRVIELRNSGRTFQQIATELGFSTTSNVSSHLKRHKEGRCSCEKS